MLLEKLIDECPVEYGKTEILSLALRADECSKNSLFFCLNGSRYDGNEFIAEACAKGAACVITQRKADNCSVPQIIVPDAREALGKISARFYGNPQEKLKIIGVTGTNGKTTTTYMIASILSATGAKTGIIGTLGAFIEQKPVVFSGMTTPDPPEFFRILKFMADEKAEYVVMEVSAHALALKKVDAVKFEVAAFTNLGRDHLDYFKDTEHYAAAKERLFLPSMCKNRVFNADDVEGVKLFKQYPGSLTYGLNNPADVFAVNERCSLGGIRFVMNLCDDIIKICCALPGRFNIYNALCAAAAVRLLGVGSRAICDGLKKLTGVTGRFNVISGVKSKVVIDFAHTEESLENALDSVRECSDGKVVVVFGCGGDRDAGKRAGMGRTASEKADFCVITSDNPRYEQPEKIIGDICSGIKKDNYVAITERKEAIRYALECAGDNGIVLIAGKGGENYQEICGVKYEYSDEQYIRSLIEEKVIK